MDSRRTKGHPHVDLQLGAVARELLIAFKLPFLQQKQQQRVGGSSSSRSSPIVARKPEWANNIAWASAAPVRSNTALPSFNYLPRKQRFVGARSTPRCAVQPGSLSLPAGLVGAVLLAVVGAVLKAIAGTVQSREAIADDYFDVVLAKHVEGPAREPCFAYRVKRMRGDGRCMFRAIAQGAAQAEGRSIDETREADRLRREVADRMPRYRKVFEKYRVIEEPFDKYIYRLRNPSYWGGEPELIVLADLLKKQIYVYIQESAPIGEFINIQQYGVQYENAPIIRILYNGSNHYDLLQKHLEVEPAAYSFQEALD
eukprot:tig00001416_g8949.t1